MLDVMGVEVMGVMPTWNSENLFSYSFTHCRATILTSHTGAFQTIQFVAPVGIKFIGFHAFFFLNSGK